jgi:hypothetical protein
MWGDEASAMLNVVSKDYVGLLGPLSHDSPSPILFLWLERFTLELLGDSTLALRLPPLLASVALLLWSAAMFPRWIPLAGACVSLTLLATSNRLVWHAVEAKPYAFDILAALAMPSLFFGLTTWSYWGRLLLQGVLAPLVIGLCYPGVFVMGGILAATLPIGPGRSRRDRVCWVLLGMVVVGSFLFVLLGPAQSQRNASVDSCWTSYFPRWHDPWSLPGWVALSWGSVPDYAFRPIGMGLAPLVLLGGILLYRRGLRRLVLALSLPIGLAFLASLLGKYPFGGARVLAFAAPAMSLFVGESVAWLIQQWQAGSGKAGWGVAWGMIPTAASVLIALKGLVEPWPSPDSAGAAAFVLAQRTSDAIVLGNHWEHEYYFRPLKGAFEVLRIPGEVSSRRAWLVIADVSPQERERLINAFLEQDQGRWKVCRREAFQHTDVVEIERPSIAVR